MKIGLGDHRDHSFRRTGQLLDVNLAHTPGVMGCDSLDQVPMFRCGCLGIQTDIEPKVGGRCSWSRTAIMDFSRRSFRLPVASAWWKLLFDFRYWS